MTANGDERVDPFKSGCGRPRATTAFARHTCPATTHIMGAARREPRRGEIPVAQTNCGSVRRPTWGSSVEYRQYYQNSEARAAVRNKTLTAACYLEERMKKIKPSRDISICRSPPKSGRLKKIRRAVTAERIIHRPQPFENHKDRR